MNFKETKFTAFFHDKRTRPKINMLKIHKINYNSNNDWCEMIQKTESVRNLGIIIDQHLKRDIQFYNLITKTTSRL